MSALLKSLAIASLVGSIALKTLGGMDTWILSAVALATFLALFWNQTPTTELALARRLNRFPEFEHSAELLFKSPDELSFLANLQRRKIASLFQRENPKKFFAKETRQAALALIATLVASFAIAVAPRSESASFESPPPKPPSVAREDGLRVEKIDVQILPPPYARKPKRAQSSLNLVAEENAKIVWTATLDRDGAKLFLTTSSGDSIAFKREGERTYRAEWIAKESALYELRADSILLGEGTIETRKDLPPTISALAPTERSEFSSIDSATLFVKAVVSDDYGVARTRLVVTSAKGKGESVKFKSDTIDLAPKVKLQNGAWLCETRLDLNARQLAPGDELYVFIEAEDNREPKPNLARSETFVAKILDSIQIASSEKIAMPLLRLPAHFRSQRQIIIDTEKLIAERRALDASAFRARSENLGIDQKLLRLRYGKFLGEELATSVGESENERLAKTMRDTSSNPIVKLQNKARARMPKIEDGHEHPSESQKPQSVESLIEPFKHRHDIPEAATFFSEPVKRKLKAALAEMWEAEKFLRLAEPERALPFELQALQRLKELQQEARLYVEKSGFEPPPIDEAKERLSGENAEIQSVQLAQTRRAIDTLAVIKRALTILASEKNELSDDDLQTLEDAGKTLARRLLERGLKHLAALRSLRELINDAKAKRPLSQSATIELRRAFADALPSPFRLPSSQNARVSLAGKRYFETFDPKR
ncbi:MAG: DUF4175 domain-containing protein [Chloroherpetonaceae bacterium]|nr:DUF4175 domain-containing protein [Chloroherpetonaceae bacterium]MDW8436859.1 hypothetical protein [Chloroherpetonaceae bacterium]